MPEQDVYALEAAGDAAAAVNIACPQGGYNLQGPQVEPESSWWIECIERNGCPAPRPVRLNELTSRIGLNDPANFFPTDQPTLRAEIEELIILARLRDEPAALAHEQQDMGGRRDLQRSRLPLSMFLQLRPQPLGAVINTARDNAAFPVINSGRELGRYFESETPGLSFQLALDYMIRETNWSPPRQAWVWAALHVTILSALEAAWFLKWRGGPKIEFRPRPYECYTQLDVLFDRVPNSTNSADAQRRSYPPGVRPEPQPFRPGEKVTPEAAVPDVIALTPPQSYPTPGTPRHPAYPSGHSTYSAAAARLLIEFFPRYREELCRMADNIGLARLWAGVHWRSDHTFGQKVGTAVAELVIEQLRASGIPRFPRPRPGNETPPRPPANPCPGGPHWDPPPPADPPDLLCREPARGAGGTKSSARSSAKSAAKAGAKTPRKGGQSRRGTSRR
jgi:membrane-associated phospholipid phosphatase